MTSKSDTCTHEWTSWLGFPTGDKTYRFCKVCDTRETQNIPWSQLVILEPEDEMANKFEELQKMNQELLERIAVLEKDNEHLERTCRMMEREIEELQAECDGDEW